MLLLEQTGNQGQGSAKEGEQGKKSKALKGSGLLAAVLRLGGALRSPDPSSSNG